MAFVCPPCKKIIEPGIDPSFWVLVQDRSCRQVSEEEAQKAYQDDPHVIICLIHLAHSNAFKAMVEAGDYPPNSN
jgi:hypothetical protein